MKPMPMPGSPEEHDIDSAASTVAVVALVPGADAEEMLIPADAARSLGVADDGTITLRVGPASASARIRIHKGGTGSVFGVAPALASALSLPTGIHLGVLFNARTSELRFGPFVGILALRARRGPLYGEHEPFFQALTRQGRRMGVAAFMFSPRDVRWPSDRIDGYVFSPAANRRGWRKLTFPFPDVVYDRVQTRRAESGPNYVRFRRRMAAKVSAWFNASGFFDKWRVHSMLWENDRLRPYLPETTLYMGVADLERMLQSYPVAYVKPVAGSLGVGIMKIRRQGAGFVVGHEIGDRAVTRFRPNLASLHRLVSSFVRGRPYIVQQGLPLARWRGRPFDVRILMQRGVGGEWAVTKMFSRIAAPGGITSNLSRGADACNIHLLLRRVFGRGVRSRMYRQLLAVGMHCAREIAATLPGPIGELGLDLGLTRGGRIWLIEANSKPFLQMNREAGSVRTLALSVRRPLQYAKHLAGFS